jgi:hypothetical protein
MDQTQVKEAVTLVIQGMIYEKFGYGKPIEERRMGGVRNHDKQKARTFLEAMLAFEPNVSVNHTGFIEDDDTGEYGVLLKDEIDVEKVVIQKDLYMKLSNEAKYVVNLIYTCPQEVLTLGDRITRRTILQFLKQKQGWSTRVINRVCKELKVYCECF